MPRRLPTPPLALLLGLATALGGPSGAGAADNAQYGGVRHPGEAPPRVAPATEGDSGGDAEVEAVDSLMAVYREARSADPKLRGRRAELAALRDDRREALGGLLPSLSASVDISRINRDQLRATTSYLDDELQEDNITREYTQEQYQLNATQPLLDLPAWHRWQGQDRRVDAGEAELEARRQQLIYDVAEAYLNVLGAQSKVALKGSELDQVQAQRERIEALYEEGEATTSERAEVRARYDQVRAELLRAQGEVATAREALTALTDEPHERLAGLRPDAELPKVEPQARQRWSERAVTGNPNVVAARARTESEQRKARAARAERYPRINLTGGFSRYDDFDGTRFGRNIEDWSIGVQVRMPLYEGGAMRARASSAEHRRARQAQELERARRQARKEVRSAYEGLMSGRSEIEAYRLAVRSAERTIEAMRQEVRAGTRTVTDLLEAQRKRFEAGHGLAQARHQYLLDILALRRAAGHLDERDVRALDELFSAGASGGVLAQEP